MYVVKMRNAVVLLLVHHRYGLKETKKRSRIVFPSRGIPLALRIKRSCFWFSRGTPFGKDPQEAPAGSKAKHFVPREIHRNAAQKGATLRAGVIKNVHSEFDAKHPAP